MIPDDINKDLTKRRYSDIALPTYLLRNNHKENDANKREVYINRSSNQQRGSVKSRKSMRYQGSSTTGNCSLGVSFNESDRRKRSSSTSSRSRNAVGRSQSMRTVTASSVHKRAINQAKRVSSAPVVHHKSSPNLDRSTQEQHHYNFNEEYDRLRNFSTTRKGGIVNRGDSFRSKSRSNQSVTSTCRSGTKLSQSLSRQTDPEAEDTMIQDMDNLELNTEERTDVKEEVDTLKVLMIGGYGVGKTALTAQFKTSEYICACDASQDIAEEKLVPVVIDDQEYQLSFIEPPPHHLSYEYSIIEDPDAYIIVYSVTCRTSFKMAKEMLAELYIRDDNTHRRAIILVANKIDLVRSRVVSTEEGRWLAKTNKCKYVETSVGINHNVDYLLVGILTQIRLRRQFFVSSENSDNRDPQTTKTSRSSPGTMLKKLLMKAYNSSRRTFTSKSTAGANGVLKPCDNLQIL